MSKEVFGRADEYREQVERSIGFLGQKIDYFTDAKAEILLRLAERHLGPADALRALDVGCGVGLTDERLVGHLLTLDGVDVNEDAVKSAAELCPRGRYQLYDGGALPFADGAFDLVFTINVLHHIPPDSWRHFISEMGRVTRTGGMTAIFEHNPFNPLTRLAVSRCEMDEGANLVSHRIAERIFSESGLSIIDSSYIIFFPFPHPLLKRVESALRWLPLGAQYYVAGRKED